MDKWNAKGDVFFSDSWRGEGGAVAVIYSCVDEGFFS